MKAFYTALLTKFNTVDGGGAHNTFWTDIGGRLYDTEAPADAVYPYCVFTHGGDPADDFKDKNDEISIQFSIFSSNPSPNEVDDAMTHLKVLFDDCSLTISGNTLEYFIRGGEGRTREDAETPDGSRVWHYYVDYNARLRRS
jgi:hypothetical protein